MISSKNILHVKELGFVAEFLQKHNFQAKLLEDGEDYSLLLFRSPLCVEIVDGLSDNCLQIVLGDISTSMMMLDGSVLHLAFEHGWVDSDEARNTRFPENEESRFFLSSGTEKIHNLYFFLRAMDKLLPLLGSNGIKIIENTAFSKSTGVSDLLQTMPNDMRERYLACIQQT